MSPLHERRVACMAPGDRGPYLRQLVARLTAERDAILAEGPDAGPRRLTALDRAEGRLRKARTVARRYDVRLDVDHVEIAQARLTDAQRRALADALADPVACAALADACLSRHGLGAAVHA